MQKLILRLRNEPFWTMFFAFAAMIFFLMVTQTLTQSIKSWELDTEMFLWFLLVGFVAQSIDGALGMAYGVSCNSILLGIGIPPAAASAWVHFAQVFTSLASGISHWKMGNVDWKLAKKLLIPGVIGSMIGAFLLSNVDGDMVKPVIAVYLLVMGFVILRKARKSHHASKFNRESRSLPVLATTGGFADAIGGGGWGPIVNSTLLSKGKIARYAIGTGNFVEFFVSLASASTFLFFVKELSLAPVLGLILGGIIAAPFAAYICKLIKPKYLMVAVGILIIILSIRTFYLAIF
ncbi:sulfite exporter TauE/SafE family protein [Algoriphagus sp.]|uniref:sulfite exporter TauE/SafE family protein n=1 Tax=Algoriphagus sp. TaxID=1872435 RepID=UPI0027256221|nr:sulfite exporter TauE/SafE family protein [Algoriphagus sp.]MDO8966372.1 sulfite exporter TauE/SafE family protein [Algoriphagus sp.]MDP3202319.1 sulfite exporter TauE/SafE family protein [Algoriphagus sp.]